MSYLLLIDTSTKNCSVALSDDGQIVSWREKNEGYSHAEYLAVMIQEVLQEAKIGGNDIAAVAVAKGPGSYTGLRIGVSTAKGLCYGLDIPLISIETLQSMVYQSELPEANFYVPMIDARRMEVYCAVYNDKKEPIEPTVASIVDETSFADYLDNGKVLFFGDGALKCKEVIQSDNALFSSLGTSAKAMASLAYQKFQQQDFEDVAYFEPFYLKDFVAGKPRKVL